MTTLSKTDEVILILLAALAVAFFIVWMLLAGKGRPLNTWLPTELGPRLHVDNVVTPVVPPPLNLPTAPALGAYTAAALPYVPAEPERPLSGAASVEQKSENAIDNI